MRHLCFLLAGLALGYLLAKYLKKLIEKHIPEEVDISGITKAKFVWIFALCAGALALAASLVFSTNIPKAVLAALSSLALAAIFAIDLYHYVIFDRFQIAMAVLAIANVLYDIKSKTGYSFRNHIIGLLIAAVLFGGVCFIGSKIYKKEVMGMGDVKLAIVAGFYLGWQVFLFSMLLSTVLGSIILLAIRKKGEEGKEYPFAPFLSVGILTGILFGSQIVESYLLLFSL